MATGFSSTPPFNAVVHVAVDDATRLTNGKAERFIQTLLTNLAGNYN
jgi:hypothetical protein